MNVLLFHERVLYDTIMYIDITNMYIRGVSSTFLIKHLTIILCEFLWSVSKIDEFKIELFKTHLIEVAIIQAFSK